MTPDRRPRKDLSEPVLGTLLLLPAVLLLLAVVVYPIATLFWTSLHGVDNANPAAGEHWLGFANYTRAFDDSRFWHSTGQTIIYIVVTVPGALVVGLALALLANLPFKVKWPVRLSLLLPWALPLVFAGLIFRWFFEYQAGIVNDLLAKVGIEPLQLAVGPDAGDDRHLHRDHLEGIVVHGTDAARRIAIDTEVAL